MVCWCLRGVVTVSCNLFATIRITFRTCLRAKIMYHSRAVFMVRSLALYGMWYTVCAVAWHWLIWSDGAVRSVCGTHRRHRMWQRYCTTRLLDTFVCKILAIYRPALFSRCRCRRPSRRQWVVIGRANGDVIITWWILEIYKRNSMRLRCSVTFRFSGTMLPIV